MLLCGADPHLSKPITNIDLPGIRELAPDLTQTSLARRCVTLILPFSAVAAYFVFALLGIWTAAVVSVMVLTFVSYGSSSHDLVHRNLGLPRRVNDFILRMIEMMCLRSGTAYQLSHLHHHRRFPEPDDVEASAAGHGAPYAIIQGVTHQFRLWYWAWCAHPDRRRWLVTEAGWFLFVCGAAVVLAFLGRPVLPAFVVLVVGGSWTIPLITVQIPHNPSGEFPLAQTRAFRGVFYDVVAFGHLYHLEHHLYPMVPHHHWRELARRLDPYLEAAGVAAVRAF